MAPPLFPARRARSADLLFGLILLLTLIFTALLLASVRAQQQARFDREADVYASAVRERLIAYVDVLRSARALWYSSEDVSAGDFRRFVNSVGLDAHYPGIQRLGYAPWVPQADLSALEQAQAAARDTSFEVTPPGVRAAYVPVIYLEPLAGAERVLGYDMYSDPQRRAALDRAVDSGNAAATAGVTLRAGGTNRTGFVIYVPVFRGFTPATPQARRAALQGFVYAPVGTADFLAGSYPASRLGQLQLRITDGDAVIHPATLPAGFRRSARLDVAGRTWQLTFGAPASFARDTGSLLPWLTALLGILIAFVARRVARTQERMQLQAEQTSEWLSHSRASLDRSRAEFEAVFRSMQDTAVFSDPQGQVRLVNPAVQHSFGLRPEQLLGGRLDSLRLSPQAPVSAPGEAEARFRRAGGEGFDAEVQHSDVRDEYGALLGTLDVIRDVTERREAERQKSESQLRYQGVLEAIPQMVWVADPEGRVRYFNTGWYDYTGLDEARSLDFGFALALHPDDVDRTLATWERSWKHLESYEIEYRIRRRDGEYHTFVGRASAVYGEGGALIEWVGTCTDIQGRIEQDALLRRSEARSRHLLESLPQIVWEADAQGTLLYRNARWAETVPPELRGASIREVAHPDDRPRIQAVWERASARQQGFELEYRLLTVRGYRSFLARGVPLRDEDGSVRGWIASVNDIDDQVYAETSARLLAEFGGLLSVRFGEAGDLRAALRLLAGPFAVAALLVQAVGAEDESLLLAADEAEQPLLQALRDRYWEQARGVAAGVMASRQERSFDDEPALQEVGLAGVLALPVLTRGGEALGALIFPYRRPLSARDLDFAREGAVRLGTALENERLLDQARGAQQQLTALNLSLEARVRERTLELEETNRELEAFSYSVSHDLRTPLRHVVGFADLLLRESGDVLGDKGGRYLGIMTDAARRMSTLIDDLLEFSRMGRQPLKVAAVDLNALFAGVRRELEPEGVEEDQRVVWNLGPLPVVYGDPALLKLVITNLLTNALKYSRTRDHSVVTVRGEVQGGEAVVSVRDNGVGFDARFGERLFGVFQRLHRQEEFEGTGIGLANVRRIVNRHGGRVWAESELDQGATFSFSLPLAPNALGAGAPRAEGSGGHAV